MPTPEALAREKIDAMLVAAGWVVQDYKELNLSANSGIALREVQLESIRNIGQERIRQLAIKLPPLAEQKRIDAEVSRRLSVVEELETVINAGLQRAPRLKQSILATTMESAL